MALINKVYVMVETERLSRSSEITVHPVEKGVDISDHVKRQPKQLSLSGRIVRNGDKSAAWTRNKLYKMQNKGTLITFKGRNVHRNMQIQSFNATFTNEVWGGFVFDMELKQAFVAESAYKKAKKSKMAKTKIKKGSFVVFSGGDVFKSSDAKQAKASRKKGKCKVADIGKGKHKYYIVSTDGKKTKGWVDGNKLTVSKSATPLNGKKNGGTRQVIKKG